MLKRDFDIFCPECGWRPTPDDRWRCEPGCGTVWHTFWTRGLCPGCAKQWVVTQCFACLRLSPHAQWYHQPDGDERQDQLPAQPVQTDLA